MGCKEREMQLIKAQKNVVEMMAVTVKEMRSDRQLHT
jgi:hypothetical protein